MKVKLTLALLLAAGVTAPAQEAPTFGAMTIRLARLRENATGKKFLESGLLANMTESMRSRVGAGMDELDRITVVMTQPPATIFTLKKDVDRVAIYKATNVKEIVAPGSVPGLPNASLATGEYGVMVLDGKRIIGLDAYWNRRGPNGEAVGLPEPLKQKIVASLPGLLKLEAEAQPAAGSKEMLAGFLKIEEIVRAEPRMAEELPPAIRPLLMAKGAKLSATMNGNVFELTVKVEFPDAAKAAAGKDSAVEGLKLGAGLLEQAISTMPKDIGQETFDVMKALLTSLKAVSPKLDGTTVVATMGLTLDDKFFVMLEQAVKKVREAAARSSMMNNFKQIGLSMHIYNDTFNVLPQNIYSKDGKTALLSWRVQILPYIEQDALYKEFKLDEPWDSEHNKKLLRNMPRIYLHTVAKTDVEGGTFVQSFVGEEKHKFYPMLVRGKDTKLAIHKILDGSSNTILVAEGETAVPWTKPDDIAFDPDGPRPKVGKHWNGGFIACMGDGSVRMIEGKLSDKNLKRYIMINDGEVVSDD